MLTASDKLDSMRNVTIREAGYQPSDLQIQESACDTRIGQQQSASAMEY